MKHIKSHPIKKHILIKTCFVMGEKHFYRLYQVIDFKKCKIHHELVKCEDAKNDHN
jgi:hypothetical protein